MTEKPAPNPRQPAYDAVYAVLRQQPVTGLAGAMENARVWRAVEAALKALEAAGWQPATRTPILYVDALVGQVTDEMVTAYKRAYAAAWKAAAPVTTQGDATMVERDAVRAGLAAVSQIGVNAPRSGSCPCTCHQPDRCPCKPGAPEHKHGAGGYCTVGDQLDPDPNWSHRITFAADGSWHLEHPRGCRTAPLDFDCNVRRLAEAQLPRPELRAWLGRYECGINEAGDTFLLGDRADVCTCPDVDVSTIAEKPGSSTVKGLDRACPVHGRRDQAAAQPRADHPHTDPGDGRSECDRCGKYVWPAIHSCKGVPVTERAWARFRARHAEEQTEG